MNKSIGMLQVINRYCGQNTPLGDACTSLFRHTVLEADEITPSTINQVDVSKLPVEAIKELSADASMAAETKQKLDDASQAAAEAEQAKTDAEQQYNELATQMAEKVDAAAQQAEQDTKNQQNQQNQQPNNRQVSTNG